MAADALTRAIARVLDRIHLGPRRKYSHKGRWWLWPGHKSDRGRESHSSAVKRLGVVVFLFGISSATAIAIIAKSSGWELGGGKADWKIDLYQPPKIAIAPPLPAQNQPSSMTNAISSPVILSPMITQNGSSSTVPPGTQPVTRPVADSSAGGGMSDSERFLVVPNPMSPSSSPGIKEDRAEDSPLVD